MKQHRENYILRGLVIILFAVALFLDKMEVFPNIPVLKLGMSAILLYIMFTGGLLHKSFLALTFPLGIIACLFSSELGIDKVAPAIIILVSILVGIGLSMIFDRKGPVKVMVDMEDCAKSGHFGGSSSVEYSEADGNFDVDNNLGTRTEYVTVKNLRHGKIDNALGSLTVYLNGTTIDPNGAHLEMDNGLGSLKVFIPKEFRVSMNVDNGLGTINTHGKYSSDETQPLLQLDIDNGLGTTDIYFE